MRIFLIVAALYLMNGAVAAAAQQTAAPAATGAAGGDWRKTWKVGPDRYAFEGISGGCHYSGTVSPSSYHLDRSC